MKLSDLKEGQVWRDGVGKLRQIKRVEGSVIYWRRVSLAGVVYGPVRKTQWAWIEKRGYWLPVGIKVTEGE